MKDKKLFVSCLYDLDYQIKPSESDYTQRLRHDRRIEWANSLLTCDVDLIFFCDYDTSKLLIVQNPRHQIVVYDITKCKSWQLISQARKLRLPNTRYNRKDTLDYLKLINCKVELMYTAQNMLPGYGKYTWIDSGIFKLCNSEKDRLFARKMVQARAVDFNLDVICSPGSYLQEYGFKWIITDNPDWKFLGGLLDVPADLLAGFHQCCLDCIRECIYHKVITWEVNIWSAISRRFPEKFGFYYADHDIGMFNFYRYST